MAENPKYDDCPEYCPKGEEHDEDVYCKVCPLKDLWKQFEDKSREWIKSRVGDVEWSLEVLMTDFSNALACARQVERGYAADWTAVTCRLVDIIRREDMRLDRIEEWERAQEEDQ